MIRIYRFNKAPKELQALSTNGGDEDWLAVIPKDYQSEYLSFLECEHFGCCTVNEYKYKDKIILIGCHA